VCITSRSMPSNMIAAAEEHECAADASQEQVRGATRRAGASDQSVAASRWQDYQPHEHSQCLERHDIVGLRRSQEAVRVQAGDGAMFCSIAKPRRRQQRTLAHL